MSRQPDETRTSATARQGRTASKEGTALQSHVAELGKHEAGQWLAHSEGEPLFAEPWQAQVFAMAVKLHESGLFSWQQWSELLGEEIVRAQQTGDPDLGDTYYLHWLSTLERMLKLKAVATNAELEVLKHRWDEAAQSTPHGQPITIDSSLP